MPSRPVLGPTQPPIQWTLCAFSPGIKLPGLTTYLQLVLRPRKLGSIHPLPHTSSWCSAYLVKHRDNFIFTYCPYAIRQTVTTLKHTDFLNFRILLSICPVKNNHSLKKFKNLLTFIRVYVINFLTLILF
jgi:hypothetical protein